MTMSMTCQSLKPPADASGSSNKRSVLVNTCSSTYFASRNESDSDSVSACGDNQDMAGALSTHPNCFLIIHFELTLF